MPKDQKQEGELIHHPVLANEVLDCLKPEVGESYLDLTAGYGGHAELIASKTGSPEKAVLVDRDEMAIASLEGRFEGARIIHNDFLTACKDLAAEGERFDLILADLGVSSPHLDIAERGFSFSQPGPLDMRMDQSRGLSAAELVNEASEEELARILKEYGEEPKAKAIAANIIENRPISDTNKLASIVSESYGRWARNSRVHPATRTFQALRIAVNDELGQLALGLPLMCELLAPGGRLAIISFHSLEDRLVKQYFAEHAGDRYDAELRPITARPIIAGRDEISFNPRARSAKLRAVAKIKNQ
ncbi:MAG TPA: 16S rRNA (cytosine(1402)-N(4))-methyltransferase RsmH [Candidatus Saccharimonadales bacterium]|nr:16S rRNA (cytosine(1402)-N(4))-methyltransferase RsmH [Candidatus Saccharimonadales bacterium]